MVLMYASLIWLARNFPTFRYLANFVLYIVLLQMI